MNFVKKYKRVIIALGGIFTLLGIVGIGFAYFTNVILGILLLYIAYKNF